MHQRLSDCFEYFPGRMPLLVSVPHDGRSLPPAIGERMHDRARELPDTDWHVARLYGFAAGLGASVVVARYSRYVVDLNRASTDEVLYDGRFVTGLCPDKTFDDSDIYLPGRHVGDEEKLQRIARYWQPYHDRIAASLDEIKQKFGYALLWDAHSIPSRVPLLFDDELPEMNFGSNDGRSCAKELIDAVVAESAATGSYSTVVDGRFKGGYITRHYGQPASGVHAIQLELAQRCYMSEETLDYDESRAARLQRMLAELLQVYLSSAANVYGKRNDN